MTLEIIQSDREIAAEALEALCDPGGAAIVREGRWDSYWLVQTIARARIAGWNAAVEAAACGAEDYPSNQYADINVIRGIAYYIRNLRMEQTNDLPQDVVSLVIAAREAWEEHGSSGDDLDKALERFSERVPYDNDPEIEAALVDQEGKDDE